MTKYKAKFIVLEGIDGTGKTTTAKKLEEHYKSLGKKVFLYHEPYKFASFNVKEIINNFESEQKSISDFAVLNLMIASRDISINNILIPELEKNDIVIADRYYYSTYAYQEDLVHRYFDSYSNYIENSDYPFPDKILFFYVKDMEHYKNSQLDIFEIQSLETFQTIEDNYFDIFTDLMNIDGESMAFEVFMSKQLYYIEVDQQKQPYFDFNQVLQALEEL